MVTRPQGAIQDKEWPHRDKQGDFQGAACCRNVGVYWRLSSTTTSTTTYLHASVLWGKCYPIHEVLWEVTWCFHQKGIDTCVLQEVPRPSVLHFKKDEEEQKHGVALLWLWGWGRYSSRGASIGAALLGLRGGWGRSWWLRDGVGLDGRGCGCGRATHAGAEVCGVERPGWGWEMGVGVDVCSWEEADVDGRGCEGGADGGAEVVNVDGSWSSPSLWKKKQKYSFNGLVLKM